MPRGDTEEVLHKQLNYGENPKQDWTHIKPFFILLGCLLLPPLLGEQFCQLAVHRGCGVSPTRLGSRTKKASYDMKCIEASAEGISTHCRTRS